LKLSKFFGWTTAQTSTAAGGPEAGTNSQQLSVLSTDDLRHVAGGINRDGTHV
jgi:hypothetical protein